MGIFSRKTTLRDFQNSQTQMTLEKRRVEREARESAKKALESRSKAEEYANRGNGDKAKEMATQWAESKRDAQEKDAMAKQFAAQIKQTEKSRAHYLRTVNLQKNIELMKPMIKTTKEGASRVVEQYRNTVEAMRMQNDELDQVFNSLDQERLIDEEANEELEALNESLARTAAERMRAMPVPELPQEEAEAPARERVLA